MKNRRFINKLLGIFTLTIFILSNILLPAYAGVEGRNTYVAPTLVDPFGPLDPGGWGRMNTNPTNNILDLASDLAPKKVPVDVKSLNGLTDTGDYVSVTSGIATPKSSDLLLFGQHLPLNMDRVYTGDLSRPGPLGYGWTFSYHQYLQMYEEFKIVEYKGNGNHETYDYTKNNPDQLVSSCDGDPLIYYNLDDGYYSPVSPSNKSTLTRHSGDSYTVKTKDGTTYYYAGYKAPWRSQAPEAGKLTAIEDRNGNRITLTYDSNGNLSQVQDPYGRKLTFQYDNNLLTTVVDPVGRTIAFTYDSNNNLTTVTGLDGATETYTYDNDHRLISRTNALGHTITYAYNSEGKVSQSLQSDGKIQRNYTYLPDEKKTVVTDIEGNSTTYYYDENNNIISKEDAFHNITGYTWDIAGNLTGVIQPDGTKTEYTYDSNHNLTAIIAFNGLTTHYEYDPTYNQLTKISDPNGAQTVYE